MYVGSIESVERRFPQIEKENPREAAEVALAIAIHHQKMSNVAKAISFARKSISLFENCGTVTLEQCTAIHSCICGIVIPVIVHEDMVRLHFAQLLATET